MPLPLLLGIGAAIAGATGIGLGIKGACDLSDAKDTLEKAQKRDQQNIARHESVNKATLTVMDNLGKTEMSILASFKDFSNLIRRIQNKPEFSNIIIGDTKVPYINYNDLEKASVGAAILVGGLGGAALGTAAGFAASSATTAAVMAIGTASTGTAISTLSGVAATNATLAALGGGSLAAGGGGMALGSAILGGATLGVGLLVGGIIFSISGSNVSDKADKAWKTMLDNEKKVDEACAYLNSLKVAAESFLATMRSLNNLYKNLMNRATSIVNSRSHSYYVNWNNLSPSEKLVFENLILVVGTLYNMCKVQLVKKVAEKKYQVNYTDIDPARRKGNDVLSTVSTH